VISSSPSATSPTADLACSIAFMSFAASFTQARLAVGRGWVLLRRSSCAVEQQSLGQLRGWRTGSCGLATCFCPQSRLVGGRLNRRKQAASSGQFVARSGLPPPAVRQIASLDVTSRDG
jgi:hypothetical protein